MILVLAEKKCTFLSSHHMDAWTPELMKALKNKRYWRTQLTKTQKIVVKLGIVESISKFKEASRKYKEALKEYNVLSKDAKNARIDLLKERAEYAAQLKDTEAAKEIKSILEVERQRAKAKQWGT